MVEKMAEKMVGLMVVNMVAWRVEKMVAMLAWKKSTEQLWV